MTRDRFLDAMSQAATTVSLATTDGPAGRAGMTVSSLCSLSAVDHGLRPSQEPRRGGNP